MTQNKSKTRWGIVITSYNDLTTIVINIGWYWHKDTKVVQVSRTDDPVEDLLIYGNMIYYSASITDKSVQFAYLFNYSI